jgi:hypothetical protein
MPNSMHKVMVRQRPLPLVKSATYYVQLQGLGNLIHVPQKGADFSC